MDPTDVTIEKLRLELARLQVATTNIRSTIDSLQQSQRTSRSTERTPTPPKIPITTPVDRDGTEIRVGIRVHFLTTGRFDSTHGTVTRFSRHNERVFATDQNGNEIARAPHNLRVSVIQNDEQL